MAREKEMFRYELEQIRAKFGDKYVLTLSDVARYAGKDRRWCQRVYNIEPKKGITQIALARAMS